MAEVTEAVPKPMVEIGGRPLLWHIMRHYAGYGHEEFFVALGYRGEVVKRYFLDYHTVNGDLTIGLADGRVRVEKEEPDDWVVHLVDTLVAGPVIPGLKALVAAAKGDPAFAAPRPPLAAIAPPTEAVHALRAFARDAALAN